MQQNNNVISTASTNDKIVLRELLIKYSYHWKLFISSIIVALLLAVVYLKFASYEYQVSSTILINDEDNDGGSTSEISAFEDLGLFEGPKTSLDTEMGVLKSMTLMERVVKELQLNVTYYTENGFSYNEIYQDERPFNINIFANESKLHAIDTIFSIKAKADNRFNLFDSENKFINEASFGESVICDFGNIVVTPLTLEHSLQNEKIFIRIRPVEDVSIDLKKRIEIAPDNINSNLLVLKLQDQIRLRAKDVLDNLVIHYNKDAIEYKRQIAKNTDKFVSNRIDDVSVQLKNLDQGVQSYKTRNSLSNLDSEASLVMASNAQLANRIVDFNSQIKLIEYVSDYMKNNKDELIPANLGLLNDQTSQNSLNYNNLILERNRLQTSANDNNPAVINLNNQIVSLRESIDQSLLNTKSSLEISLAEAKIQEGGLNAKLAANPRKEREIRDIERQQKIYETLYLYLLQKREENSISLAVTAPNAKIVEKAYGSRVPVAPRKLVVLMSSLLLGFLVPISFITLKAVFDNKVQSVEDVSNIIAAPILGEIPASISEKGIISFNYKKQNVPESFRLLRTNVNHLLRQDYQQIEKYKKRFRERELIGADGSSSFNERKNLPNENIVFALDGQIKTKDAKTIFITSTIRNEGKTFIAINLAMSLALLNKRVLLIEGDIRYPKINKYLNLKSEFGLTDFLTTSSLEIDDVISYDKKTNLDVLPAGSKLKNPGEILANGRFDELLKQSKSEYDYVVVDTCSLNAAADTMLLAYHAELFIYVVRANILSKKMLSIPKVMHENNRLPNMAILMNGEDYEKRGYDSNYAFGDEETNKSWLRKLFK